MKTPELCIEVGEFNECMRGELLLTALVLECTVYFLIFVFGYKIVERIKSDLNKKKS